MTDDKNLEVILTLGELTAFVKFIQEEEREACALVCDALAAQDKLSNYYSVAARAIRERVIDVATVGEVGVWGENTTEVTTQVTTQVTGDVDAVNMSEECVHKSDKGEQNEQPR